MKNFIYLILSGALAFASCSKDDPAPVEVGEVKLNKTTLTLAVGEEQTLTATVLPDNAENKTVAWSSSDTKIATVSDAGLVKAVAVGSATITATGGGKSATCAVTVEPITVESVTLDRTELTLKPGDSETLTATVLPDDATDPKVVWTTSDKAIATISDAGLVTPVAPGKATITATAGAQSATCTVTVEPDVYVVGHSSSDYSVRKGLLWKNGVVSELPLLNANSLYISKGAVYVCGNYYKDNDAFASPVIWKDGTLVELERSGTTEVATSIFIDGETVYAAGHAGGNTAYLWKDGVRSLVNTENRQVTCKAYTVAVSDGDVYVGGDRRDGTADRSATYWKNGVATNLTDGSEYASIRSIAVVNGVVYAAVYGYESGTQKAMLWTNGVKTVLPEGKGAYSVCVAGNGDVYVAGQDVNRKPLLWKNGEPTKLSDSNGIAYAVFVYNDDVYVAGQSDGKATLWKNGVEELLPNGYVASSVFVY